MKNAMSDLCRKDDSSFERQLADHGIVQVFLNDNPVDEDGLHLFLWQQKSSFFLLFAQQTGAFLLSR
jgi:hypothetical protein